MKGERAREMSKERTGRDELKVNPFRSKPREIGREREGLRQI